MLFKYFLIERFANDTRYNKYSVQAHQQFLRVMTQLIEPLQQ